MKISTKVKKKKPAEIFWEYLAEKEKKEKKENEKKSKTSSN